LAHLTPFVYVHDHTDIGAAGKAQHAPPANSRAKQRHLDCGLSAALRGRQNCEALDCIVVHVDLGRSNCDLLWRQHRSHPVLV